LTPAESADLLHALLQRRPERRPEAEALAESMLSYADSEGVADDVEDAIRHLDVDELYTRAGGQPHGYVEPGEAAADMIEEALAPFTIDLQ
jgi:hypothetical protein